MSRTRQIRDKKIQHIKMRQEQEKHDILNAISPLIDLTGNSKSTLGIGGQIYHKVLGIDFFKIWVDHSDKEESKENKVKMNKAICELGKIVYDVVSKSTSDYDVDDDDDDDETMMSVGGKKRRKKRRKTRRKKKHRKKRTRRRRR